MLCPWAESFLETERNKHGSYEPLIGYLVLEAIPAAVDMLGHRLVPETHFDLKEQTRAGRTTAILKSASATAARSHG